MFKDTPAFSGFSVDDQAAAQKFYGETLGLSVSSDEMGLEIQLAGGGKVFVYPKPNHQPASYTMLNFVVSDIDKAVADLKAKGVQLEVYPDMHQDENGIARGRAAGMGPDIAWFKDPAGNILAVLQND
ncbi:MAG TPA: VOC family protein [Candidatus Saccharimonadales bacterium]|nr:VOC family protein [Candidatus Saccharimonadales bacterium]